MSKQWGSAIVREKSSKRHKRYGQPKGDHRNQSTSDNKRKYNGFTPENIKRKKDVDILSNRMGSEKGQEKISQPRIVRLHKEIKAFYADMSPSPEDQQIREDVVARITQVVKSLWPAAVVGVFGSFETGLYLPSSDIDLVIFGLWSSKPLFTLRDELIAKGVCTDEMTRVIDKATVPIIKITDKLTQIKVDIAFNVTNGQNSAKLVKMYRDEFPSLPYLLLVLKQFLQQRDLNEVYTGGIGSYGLILMIVNFLQLQARGEGRLDSSNYGVLLLEFFELYGQQFNYCSTGLSVQDGGKYLTKSHDTYGQPSLFIQDPICKDNDVSRGSFNIAQVQAAFGHAYKVLCNEVGPSSHNKSTCILSSIIQVERERESNAVSVEVNSIKKTKKEKRKNFKNLDVKQSFSDKPSRKQRRRS